jgi:2-amino-4-hydroxy-6-hydroxymethyldihydropteridine diphosphokinase
MLVYLALGSNVGDRQQHIRAAIQGLSDRGIQIIRCASIYLTEPREFLNQPWFLNTVLEANTSLDPDKLLKVCLEVEEDNLRKRDISKGPRTLDIDIIFFGREVIRKPGLEIPHRRFSKRRFVLEPLAEIASEFVDPVSGRTIRQLLQEVSDPAQVERLR